MCQIKPNRTSVDTNSLFHPIITCGYVPGQGGARTGAVRGTDKVPVLNFRLLF